MLLSSIISRYPLSLVLSHTFEKCHPYTFFQNLNTWRCGRLVKSFNIKVWSAPFTSVVAGAFFLKCFAFLSYRFATARTSSLKTLTARAVSKAFLEPMSTCLLSSTRMSPNWSCGYPLSFISTATFFPFMQQLRSQQQLPCDSPMLVADSLVSRKQDRRHLELLSI